MKSILSTIILSFALFAAPVAFADDAPKAEQKEASFSLITATPEEGFQLAITLSRKTVKTIQPDVSVLHEQRDSYAKNARFLIEASEVVAHYFDTIAKANNYWRE